MQKRNPLKTSERGVARVLLSPMGRPRPFPLPPLVGPWPTRFAAAMIFMLNSLNWLVILVYATFFSVESSPRGAGLAGSSRLPLPTDKPDGVCVGVGTLSGVSKAVGGRVETVGVDAEVPRGG